MLMERPRITLFGPPALQVRETRARFRTRKHAGLLAYLALEGRNRPIERERLIELFWPGVAPDLARHSLSQALTAIRQHLGRDALVATVTTVQLRAAVTTDLDALARGDRAGPLTEPLQGLDACAGAELAHWVDAARVRARNAARDALIDQMEQLRAAGEVFAVHDRAQLLFELDPLSEAAITALAERALLRGDRVAAIRLLREHAERTEHELGCAPSVGLQRLLKRLEAGSHPPIGDVIPVPGARRREEQFVGRAPDMAMLEAAWGRARRGTFETAVLVGPAGIGKSSLLRRFATGAAARAHPVFVVTCQEIGHGVPFAAVADLMMALSRDPALSATDPQWLAEASRVCPGLRAVYPGIPDEPPAPAESVRLRVGEALYRMLETVADGAPVLLGFDDVQHMDPASRDVLYVVARRLEGTRTMVIGAARSTETGTAWQQEGDPEGLPWQQVFSLAPLTGAETAELVDLLAPKAGDDIAGKITDLGQGNPYFIEMLVGDWERHDAASLVAAEARGDGTGASWQPPATLRLAFERQYSGLSEAARGLLQLLAVAGRAMRTAELGRLPLMDDTALSHAILELLARGVLALDEGALYFKNELHRAYVYYAMNKDGRKYQHLRLAELCSAREETDFALLFEAAHHFLRADMPRDAALVAVRGARFALESGAACEADRTLRRIPGPLDAQLDRQIMLCRAKAQANQGHFEDSAALLDKAPASSTPDRIGGEIALLRAQVLHRGRFVDDQVISRAAQEAVEASEQIDDQGLLLDAMQVEAEFAVDCGAVESLRAMSARVQALVNEPTSNETLAKGLRLKGFCALAAGDLDVATDALTECAPRALARSEEDAIQILNGLGISLTHQCRFADAYGALSKTLAIVWRLRDRSKLRTVLSNIGSMFGDLGWFDRAARYHRTAAEFDALCPSPRGSTQIRVNATMLAIVLGRFDEAERVLDEAHDLAKRSQLWHLLVDVLLQRADLALAQGRLDHAWELVDQAIRHTGGRTQTLKDQGQYFRLSHHFAIATQGLDEFARQAAADIEKVSGLIQRLEVTLFDEWAGHDQADTSAFNGMVDEAKSLGLVGMISRLVAVGAVPDRIRALTRDRCAAAVVAQMFPHEERSNIPQSMLEGPTIQLGGEPGNLPGLPNCHLPPAMGGWSLLRL